MSIGIISVIVLVVVIGIVVYAMRSSRARRLREDEARRPVDKGKHVEL